MITVVIAYPYANEKYGSDCVLYSMENGEVPVPLNAIYEHFGKTAEINSLLKESVTKILLSVNKLVVYDDLGVSRSMAEIMEIAKDYNIEVVMRQIKK